MAKEALAFTKELYRTPYSLAVKMWQFLKKKIFICDFEEKFKNSLYSKIKFFLLVKFDKSGKIEREMLHQLSPAKKINNLYELVEKPLPLYF